MLYSAVQLYLLYLHGVNNEAAQWHLVFKDWHFVVPEDDTLVPKHAADTPLTYVLIKAVYLFGLKNGVL